MKLGVIGCGNMGSALTRGILIKKVFPYYNILASDKESQKTRELYKKFGIGVGTNDDIVTRCDLIILAVKPQDAPALIKSIAEKLNQNKHLVSIMAGISISKIEKLVGKKIAITRAMPNMAAMAGKSMTCFCHNKMVKNASIVERIFFTIGDAIEIEEKYMDAVTAVTGSGPAYFFYLTEALRDAAVKLGIRKDVALKMAVATVAGSGALLESLNVDPGLLRERITSKKGTTEAAIHVFKSKNFKAMVQQAVKSAAKRSKDLSK
jgi:pyrroline-5-carboxylate reductase